MNELKENKKSYLDDLWNRIWGKCYKFIRKREENNKKVLVSCQKGLGGSRENHSKSCKKILTQM